MPNRSWSRRAGVSALLPPPVRHSRIRINSSIAEERPDAAEIFHRLQVAGNDHRFFIARGAFRDDFAVRIRYEALAPEFGFLFNADAVYCSDIASVRDGMAALNCFPGAVLGLAEFDLLAL